MQRPQAIQPATQSQRSDIWANLIESQPIENAPWGRLYGKNVKIKSLDICKETFAAGRGEKNDLCLTVKEMPESALFRISKVHFEIMKELNDIGNPVYIKDRSRNGTFVNGEKIGQDQTQILLNDDVISLSHPHYKAFVYKDLCPNEAHGLPKEICTKYHIGRKLGSGACGIVRLVYDRKTCDSFAMKHVQKNKLAEFSKVRSRSKNLHDETRIMNEVTIMKSLEHPCVIKMHDIIDHSDSVFMVLELMKGGDLLTRIIENKRLSEKISKLFFLQICHAVKYLHDKNITHRDLKPDNVLLESKDNETLVKVSDFGLSKFVQNDSVMRTLCGTPLYVAPEVLLTGGRGSYTKKVDIWSLGVVLFTMLSGTLPFSDEYGSPATEQIKRGKFAFKSAAWRSVSTQAKSVILEILTVDPQKRPSIDDVLKHKWLQDPLIKRKAEKLMKISSNESLKLGVEQRKSTESLVSTDTNANENDENEFIQPPAAKRRRI